MFNLIAIRENGSYALHLENLATVAEAEAALNAAVGQDGIVDGFPQRAGEPIPVSDGRSYVERLADLEEMMESSADLEDKFDYLMSL